MAMQPTTPLLCIMLLGASLLSGCTGSPDDAETPTDDPIVHTSVEDAQSADPDEARNRSHVHDYWGNRDTILVADQSKGMRCGACGGDLAVRFEPPAGGIVPQGTRWVNITLSWTASPDSAYSAPTLWVETAADHEPWNAGAIENGDTVQLEIDNSQADIPHESLSNWAFELHVEPPVDGTLYRMDGEAQLRVEAARGHPIPVFPPHPDLWNGTTEMLLLSQEDAADGVYYGNSQSNTGGDWLGPHRPENGTVVPYDMDHVTVTMTYDDDAVNPLTLIYHGADSREYSELQPDDVSGNVHTYTITHDMALPDGPYAKQSQWVFELSTFDQTPPVFVGGYNITATAYLDP